MQKVVIYCLLVCFVVNLIIAVDFNSQLKKLILTLNKTVEYICDHVSDMNVDVALGLTFTEVHLKSLTIRNDTSDIKRQLWKIMDKCLRCRSQVISRSLSKNKIINTLSTEMTNPNIWISKIYWRKTGHIFSTSLCPKTKQQVLDSLYKGFPQEEQSDYCLADLFLFSSSYCRYTSVCNKMLNKNDECYGYPLIHRVLYILSQKHKRECKSNFETTYNLLLENYCRRIFRSVIEIEELDLYDELKDFIMESNLLCGMAGFVDLINKDFINDITNWQQQNGCYSAAPITKRFSKRSTNLINGCDTHTTAVAAATLAMCINIIFDMDTTSIDRDVIKQIVTI